MKTVFEYKKSLDAMRFTDAEKAAMTDRLLAARGVHRRRHPLRRGAVVAVAAALCLCVAAGATGALKVPSQVFAPVFGTAETEIIDKIGHPVDASATAGGVTITADAIIADKYHYAIVYTLAKDDGTAFDADLTPIPESGALPLRWQYSTTSTGLLSGGHGSAYFFDADPADNAIQYVEQYSSNKPLSPKGQVKAVFQDLYLGCGEDSPVLAEGKWVLRFAMDFEDTSVSLPAGQKTTLSSMDMTIDAITLSPLALRVDYTVDSPMEWAEQDDGKMSEENAALQDRFLDSLPLQVTLKDGTVYDLTDTAGGSIDRQETQTVCSKDRQLPEIIALDDVASVTVGDCVIPVEL